MDTSVIEKLVKRDNVWVQKAEALYKVKQLRLQCEKTEKELLDQFKLINNGVNSIGGNYKFIVTKRKGSINYKDIPELKSVNLSLYRNNDAELCLLEYIEKNKMGA